MTILQKLKERRKELQSDAKDKKLKELLKGMSTGHDKWKEFLLIGDHRIAELDYIIILLKKEGIIPETKKDKLRHAEYEKMQRKRKKKKK